MRTVLFVVALLLVLSSGAMAQSKMEALGLRGPGKVVVEVVVKESLVSYSFSKDGYLVNETRYSFDSAPFVKKYDDLEREIFAGRDELGGEYMRAEYDSEKREYRGYYKIRKDGKLGEWELFNFGEIDSEGRIVKVYDGFAGVFRSRFSYDLKGNREKSEFVDEQGATKERHEYQYGKYNQLESLKILRRMANTDFLQVANETRNHYDSEGYLIRVERIWFEAGKEKETKEYRRYEYIFFDSYGNWTKRFCYEDGKELLEERSISYYGEGFDLFQEVLGFAKLRIMNKGAVR